MNNFPLRRLAIAAAVLGVIALLWFLPRTLGFGATPPPEPIELRAAPAGGPAPSASSTPQATQPVTVDERDDAGDDDGAGGDDDSAGGNDQQRAGSDGDDDDGADRDDDDRDDDGDDGDDG